VRSGSRTATDRDPGGAAPQQQETEMSEYDDLVAELKQKRDELRLKMHLASKDAQAEWQDLEKKMQEFSSRAELDKTSEGIGDALGKIGEELKLGYKRLRDAIKED
jgi:chromosome segregation ATPase